MESAEAGKCAKGALVEVIVREGVIDMACKTKKGKGGKKKGCC